MKIYSFSAPELRRRDALMPSEGFAEQIVVAWLEANADVVDFCYPGQQVATTLSRLLTAGELASSPPGQPPRQRANYRRVY